MLKHFFVRNVPQVFMVVVGAKAYLNFCYS